jgi:hypothetical protein
LLKSIHACENRLWTLATWRKADGSDPKLSAFRCRSWRHSGDCREECGACDFARIADAITNHDHWTYCVLTYPARDWPDLDKLFRFGVVSWARLRKRLGRAYGKVPYIQTWEVHKSGYPHANVCISNAKLQAAAARERDFDDPGFLKGHAEASGFGWKCYAEPIRDGAAMAGYLTKLGLELAGAAKKNQVPVNAPPHFRRIRASRGMLAPRFKDHNVTGKIYKIGYDELERQFDKK